MPDANASWFYASNGQRAGPVSTDVLRQLAATGQVRVTDLVWSEGMANWMPAGQVAGLLPAELIRSVPPPLPAQALPYHVPPPPSPIANDPAMRWLIPVDRSGWAIAAGYLGLFSVLFLPAPIALIVSIIAIRDIRKHPQKHGMGRAVFGLLFGILFSIGFVIMMIAIASK